MAATLHELSAAGPLLLVVDDLHQADQPTLLLLRHVLQTIDDARFGIVGMYTDTEVPSDHRLRPVLADFRALHRVEAVHLEGLSPAAVEELVSGWPGATPDLVGQLYQLTDGNPLFLDEMLRQLRYSESEARGARRSWACNSGSFKSNSRENSSRAHSGLSRSACIRNDTSLQRRCNWTREAA